MSKRTKIICTIGPSSAQRPVLEQLVIAGMNVARLNFSHGSQGNHRQLISNLRAVSRRLNRPLAIMQDLQGPRLRVGWLPAAGLVLTPGERVTLVAETEVNYRLLAAGQAKVLPLQYERLHQEVKAGAKILISDGLIELKVLKVNRGAALVNCQVTRGGTVFSFRGVNVPGTVIKAPVITEKDKEDLRFGLRQGVDWVALSFVRSAQDIKNLKKLISQYRPSQPVKVMAKIERREAVAKFDEILAVADGIMIARGDLGIELPASEVPLIQKKIAAQCLAAAKPVVVATQMLESMMVNPRPTRAEVSDIANAVIDHVDAVMLSGETATGKFPVEATRLMAETIISAERSPYDDLPVGESLKSNNEALILADALCRLAKKLRVKMIAVATDSGQTARLIARFRPETKIFALTNRPLVQRQLCLTWGVEAKLVKVGRHLDKLIGQAVKLAKQEANCRPGDKIIIAAAYPFGSQKNFNLVKVVEV